MAAKMSEFAVICCKMHEFMLMTGIPEFCESRSGREKFTALSTVIRDECRFGSCLHQTGCSNTLLLIYMPIIRRYSSFYADRLLPVV